MPSDRSRAPDRPRYGYTGVVAQQGRVILDRDFNAQQSLTADRIAADALDFVGPCGTPDDGFAISLPDDQSSPPTFWSPPVQDLVSPPETPGSAGDFLVAPGTMYVGGQRVCFPGQQGDAAVTYSYFDQPDWPSPPPPSSPPPSFELVYLAVQEQEVSAVEDPDLFEVALAGPDTTQRLKLLSRVERREVASANCSDAWQSEIDTWAKRGWIFDPDTMQLKPTARLQVGFTNPGDDGDPCDPQASGGYLGADNQLIRVRIDARGPGTHVLWGYDDASYIYRITNVAGGDTLTLADDPPDPNHFPTTGQWVEVLTTASVLAEEPDESDLNNPGEILRVVAEANGVVRQLAQPYGPLPGSTSNVILLSEALPPEVAASQLPLFLRVWQARQDIAANGGTVTLETTTTDSTTGKNTTISTGVTATLSGAPLADGAFWQIAVRPSTPQGVYPENLLVAPQPPVGPRIWACPLAVIDWTNGLVTDCRSQFDGLVALSKRKPGCCTVSISPNDVTAGTPLQALIDKAAKLARSVTVCLQPGTYQLPGTLYLDRGHAGLTLEGCGGPVVLTFQDLDDLTPFLDGMVCVDRAARVTLQGLTLRPPVVATTEAFFKNLVSLLSQENSTDAAKILRRPNVSFGVRAFDAIALTIQDCDILLAANAVTMASPVLTIDETAISAAREEALARLVSVADFFGAAIFVQGQCERLRIERCVARSTITATYTSLQVNQNDASPNTFKVFNGLLEERLAEPALAMDRVADIAVAASSPPPAQIQLTAVQQTSILDRLFHAVAPAGSQPSDAAPAAAPPAPAAPPAAAPAAAAAPASAVADIAAVRLATPAVNLAAASNIASELSTVRAGPPPPPAAPPPAAPPPPPPPPAPPPPPPAAAASPPDSPPSELQVLDQQVGSALDLVVARRLAVGVASPAYVVISVGVLAAGSLEAAAHLGEAAVTDCNLAGFTFATWFSADMRILRLENNTVSNGVAGIWLETPGAGPVPGAVPRNPYYQTTLLFEEYQLLVALATVFPAPTPPRQVRPLILQLETVAPDATAQSDFIIVGAPPPYSLVVSNNQVDVRPQTANLGASSAMMLALYHRGLVQPLTSVIVQSNRLCGGMSSFSSDLASFSFAQEVPAALVTLANGTSCAINGNVVINRGGVRALRGSNAPSLWVMISESADGIDQVAITGNVLKGQSDLGEMNRSDLQTTWSPYNADPS